MAVHGEGFRQLCQLYRAILRVHRQKLPGPLRLLGDSYAATEFRAHLAGKTTPAQWQQFGSQWQSYVAALQQQEPAGGAEVLPDVSQLELNRQQREQLAKLKQAAQDLARGGGGSSDAGGQ
jgi:hypothetical protein